LLCVAGYDGYLKKINPAVSKLLGYTNEELLSKPSMISYISLTKKTSTARNDLRKKVSLFNFENRYVTKMVLSYGLLWTSLPIDSDKVVYAIAKNITYKKLEEERNIHLAELTKSTTNSSSSPIQLLTISNLLLIICLLF
jgi:PAS domain S-box-containing protein